MFKDLKIVELASVLAGPMVGSFFSELGAQVVKIENKASQGDITRHWHLPSEDKTTQSAYYSAANFNKESLFLDLKKQEHYQKALKLINEADLVIANFKYGDAEKLKLDYHSLKKQNPLLIYGEITGYGKQIQRTAYDVILQAETGYMSMNGSVESGPIKMPVALIDILAAHQLKEGLLCALIKKLKEKKGSYVTVSLYDAAIASLANQATNWLMAKHIPQAIGSQHPNIAPYGDLFKTQDGALMVLAIGSQKQFQSLVDLLEIDLLSSNKKFSTNALRVENRTELIHLLSAKFIEHTSEYWLQLFQQKNIPIGKIKNIKEVFESKAAQDLIIEEIKGNEIIRKVKTVIFENL